MSRRQHDPNRVIALAVLAVIALLVLLWAWIARPAVPAPAPRREGAVDRTASVVRSSEAERVPPPHPSPAAFARDSVAGPSALVRGRVTDVRTGEPVPELDVRLRSGEVAAVAKTAADGSFASEAAYDLAALEVEIFDAGERIETVVRSPPREGVRWEIEVRIGPTVPVLIAVRDAASVDPAQWTARIVETALPEDCAGEIGVSDAELTMLRPCAGCRDRDWPSLALRPGPAPWIRYPRVVFEPSGSPETLRPILHVESAERVQRGQARLRATVGVQPPALIDPLERFVLFEGTVVDEHGEALGDARVLALPQPSAEGQEARTPGWRTSTTDTLGHFCLRDLAPGRALLCAWSRARPAALEPVHVVEGRSALDRPLKLGAQRKPASGGAAPRKRSQSREPTRSFLRLRLACAGSFERAWVVELANDVNTWGPLGLADLPAGLPAERLEFAWIEAVDARRGVQNPRHPQRGELHVPELVDLGTRFHGEPLLVDRTKKDLDRAWVSFEPGGALVGCIRAREIGKVQVARGADLEWALWKRACAPRFGRRADLEGEEGQLTLSAQLEEGWGAVLWFRAQEHTGEAGGTAQRLSALGYVDQGEGARPELNAFALGAPPLPVVRVLADGEMAATSDLEGVARIARPRRPERLVLVAEGWHLAGLERLWDKSGAPAVRYVAWMERD